MPTAPIRVAVLGFWHVHAGDYAQQAVDHPTLNSSPSGTTTSPAAARALSVSACRTPTTSTRSSPGTTSTP